MITWSQYIFSWLYCSDLTTEDATADTSPAVPAYITAAAEHISCALRHEAEDDIEQSLAAYRAAIGGGGLVTITLRS